MPCSPSSTCSSRPGTPRRSVPIWSAATSWSDRSTWPASCARCCPDNADVAGLLALILLTDARRREARLGDDGQLVLLADQDRQQWDRAAIGEGIALVREALRTPTAGALRPHGRHRRGACAGPVVGRHRLDRDRRALRRPGPDLAVAGRRPQPRRRHRPGGRARAPDWPRSMRWTPNRSWPPTATSPRRAPTSCASWGAPAEARVAYEEALLLSENDIERAFLADRLGRVES